MFECRARWNSFIFCSVIMRLCWYVAHSRTPPSLQTTTTRTHARERAGGQLPLVNAAALARAMSLAARGVEDARAELANVREETEEDLVARAKVRVQGREGG